VFVGTVAGRELVDTGASVSIISNDFYNRLLRSRGRFKLVTNDDTGRNIVSADISPPRVRGQVETDIKMGGILIPTTFLIFDKLWYDVIISFDLLQDTMAVVDAKTNILILFDGLTSIPMTETSEHAVSFTNGIWCNDTAIFGSGSECEMPETTRKRGIYD